jgi:hypothetical protein
LGAFPALRAGNRAFRLYLFCLRQKGRARKRMDFNPLRVRREKLFSQKADITIIYAYPEQ